jgi:hypothetical protein
MEWLFGIAVMAAMLIIRLAVPVALTLAVCHLLRRLDAKWHPQVVLGGGE